jgi:hypothetical protein
MICKSHLECQVFFVIISVTTSEIIFSYRIASYTFCCSRELFMNKKKKDREILTKVLPAFSRGKVRSVSLCIFIHSARFMLMHRAIAIATERDLHPAK